MNLFITVSGFFTLLAAAVAPSFFVNVPCLDDWSLVPMIESILSGRIPWDDFWRFHGEQRLPITRALLSFWGAWTSWDLRGVPWFNLLLTVGGVFCLDHLSAQPDKSNYWRRPSFWLATVFMLSFPAVKTINWCINLNVYLSAAAAVYAITCAAGAPHSLKRWGGAAILGALSTFSFGMGLMVWPSLLPLLWTQRNHPDFRRIILLWAGSATLCLSLYFHGFMSLQEHPSLWISLQRPLQSLHFFLIYLGALFNPLPAVFFGILGLGILGAMTRQVLSQQPSVRPGAMGLYCVLLYVLGNAFLTTLARSRFGPDYALADRYLGLSCYFWGAAAVWLGDFLSKAKPPSFVRPTLLLLILSQLFIFRDHWWNFEDNRDYMLTVPEMLKKEPPDPAELSGLFEIPGVVEKGLPILKKRKLSIFRDSSR